jgi:hypothetical protein
VWVIENAAFRTGRPAILHAYDANDVSHELFNSQQAGARDALPNGVGFGVPAVANGKVYVGTLSELDVFGILPYEGNPARHACGKGLHPVRDLPFHPLEEK